MGDQHRSKGLLMRLMTGVAACLLLLFCSTRQGSAATISVGERGGRHS